jgi:hypothetical protein
MDLTLALDLLFSEASLAIDDEFLAEVRKIRQGFVPVGVVAEHFGRRCGLPMTPDTVRELVARSSFIVLSEDGQFVRKKHPMRRIALFDTQNRSGEL